MHIDSGEADVYIGYRNSKLKKLCTQAKSANRKLGQDVAQALFKRLEQLAAFDTLEDVPHTPPFRLHLLKGDRKGQWAVDLHSAHRLVFKPVNQSFGVNRVLDRSSVTSIEITKIGDYHG
jgi:toxin HigB-1